MFKFVSPPDYSPEVFCIASVLFFYFDTHALTSQTAQRRPDKSDVPSVF